MASFHTLTAGISSVNASSVRSTSTSSSSPPRFSLSQHSFPVCPVLPTPCALCTPNPALYILPAHPSLSLSLASRSHPALPPSPHYHHHHDRHRHRHHRHRRVCGFYLGARDPLWTDGRNFHPFSHCRFTVTLAGLICTISLPYRIPIPSLRSPLASRLTSNPRAPSHPTSSPSTISYGIPLTGSSLFSYPSTPRPAQALFSSRTSFYPSISITSRSAFLSVHPASHHLVVSSFPSLFSYHRPAPITSFPAPFVPLLISRVSPLVSRLLPRVSCFPPR